MKNVHSHNSSKKSVSITIPAFNEEKTIEKVAGEALAAVSKITRDYELVLVDDGSIDKTGEIIDGLAKNNKYIKAFHHKKNRGFTGAMKTSIYSAKKHLVFFAPADGQFDFKELRNFIDAIKGYDVAIGYREVREENIIRKFNSWGFHLLCKTLFGIPFKEFSSVILLHRKVIQSIKITSKDRSAMFFPEFLYNAVKKNYRFVEVPIYWHPRRGGRAKGAEIKTIYNTLKEMIRFWFQIRNTQHKMC